MKLIIAGSRDLKVHINLILDLTLNFNIWSEDLEIVSGTARGVDTSGKEFAAVYEHKLTEFPADLEKHGRSAGMIRNREMAEYADALLLIWDGESKGSANMRRTMLNKDKPVYEVIMRVQKETERKSNG